jgi:hypothetical protein
MKGTVGEGKGLKPGFRGTAPLDLLTEGVAVEDKAEESHE